MDKNKSNVVLPQFKYNPNIYLLNDGYLNQEKINTCKCCGRQTKAWTEWMYSREDIDCICVNCIADGTAAHKFDGDFVDCAEHVSDPSKKDELMHRTPGYSSWQGEHWLVCCDDYCAFLGQVGCAELDELKISDSVIQECAELVGFDIDRKDIQKTGSLIGYLFQCLHCGQYRLWVDCD